MRIGFACQRFPQIEAQKIRSTTMTALRKMSEEDARTKLQGLAENNGFQVLNFVKSLVDEPLGRKMTRLGSGIWPMIDVDDAFARYDLSYARETLKPVGDIAVEHDIRLSFHPDQFVRLGSARSETTRHAIMHLNAVAEQALLCGATNINTHIYGDKGVSSKESIKIFRENFVHLSDDAQKRLTVENDEFGVGTNEILEFGVNCPIVLDMHHHWVNTGHWPSDDIFASCRATWGKDRFPKIHGSYPRNNNEALSLPTTPSNRVEARAHSDVFDNPVYVDWMLQAGARHDFDIMVEAKHKDVAARQLYNRAVELHLINP